MADRSENPVLRHCIDNNKIGTTDSITELVGDATVTLRDLFAAAALTGMHANPGQTGKNRDYARTAFNQADVMLEERGKRCE